MKTTRPLHPLIPISASLMIFSPRIGWASLAALCRRLSVSASAGIDARTTWNREAKRAGRKQRPQFTQIRDAVAGGESVGDAVEKLDGYFPTLFREMLAVGEKTGTLAEVLRRLAEHYENQLRLRRMFLAGITWPLIQLSFAVFVVGLLIWVLGFIAGMRGGKPIDILGFGLIGNQGLMIYLSFVGSIVAAAGVLIQAIRRGVFWAKPLQRAMLRVPMIGHALQTLCLARMAWSMQLTLNVEMDLRRSLPLAIRSTGNDFYIRHCQRIVADITSGSEIHEALRKSGAFRADFLDSVEAAELSGQLVESMARLSRQYEEQAQAALHTLVTISGFAVWAMVATLIAALIIRMAMFYIGTIYEMIDQV